MIKLFLILAVLFFSSNSFATSIQQELQNLSKKVNALSSQVTTLQRTVSGLPTNATVATEVRKLQAEINEIKENIPEETASFTVKPDSKLANKGFKSVLPVNANNWGKMLWNVDNAKSSYARTDGFIAIETGNYSISYCVVTKNLYSNTFGEIDVAVAYAVGASWIPLTASPNGNIYKSFSTTASNISMCDNGTVSLKAGEVINIVIGIYDGSGNETIDVNNSFLTVTKN